MLEVNPCKTSTLDLKKRQAKLYHLNLETICSHHRLHSLIIPLTSLHAQPTNHLDLEAIDSLADAIKRFNGGMVLVSHDFRLIDQVANEIWLCDNNKVRVYLN